MQRVLSAFSKEGKPPFSLRGLRIPERDKLQMKIHSRQAVSYDWEDAVRIAQFMRKGKLKFRERYAVMVLLGSAAGGVACLEDQRYRFQGKLGSRGRGVGQEGCGRPMQERSGLSKFCCSTRKGKQLCGT